MALSKLRNYSGGAPDGGAFVTVVSAFENASFRRVIIASDEGTCQGYERIADGALFCGALFARNQAKIDADAAAATAASDVATKTAAARLVVTNQVNRVKAIAPASRTDQDKWLLALSYLVFQLE